MRCKLLLYGTLAAALTLVGCGGGEYAKDGSAIRMQNATATIVTSVLAQQTYGNATIDAEIQRPWKVDSKLVGTTTPDTIDVKMKSSGADNAFKATMGEDRLLSGVQEKYMFDWTVQQIDQDTYEIGRVGFNGTLDIIVKDGRVSGEYHKPMGFNYTFEGHVSADGAYELELHRPLGFDWDVVGTITPN